MSRRVLVLVLGASAALANTAAAPPPLQACSAAFHAGDTGAAIRCLQPFADAGNATAEGLLGAVYGTINLPAYDAKKSAFWTRKAAEHGDLEAQVALAGLYRQGEGVPKDLTQSLRWFRIAAERGRQDAQIELGRMYFEGWGTPKDVGEAIAWERRVADQGGPLASQAEENIAAMYSTADATPKDYLEAARWWRRAAEHGSPTAYLYLAQLDEQGLGGPPNPLEAYVGYSIALGWLGEQHSPAKITDLVSRHRDEVARRLTPAQRTRADEIVRIKRRGLH